MERGAALSQLQGRPGRCAIATAEKPGDDRKARRARLLAELAEARALRERVFPLRTRLARRRAAFRGRNLRG